MSLRYLRITCPDMNNGDGCRVTLWLPGCTHKCPGCHNAWTAEYNQGKELDSKVFYKLVDILKRDEIQGLTISGGDPLDQSDETLKELYNLIFSIKSIFPDKDIWIYSGYYISELTRDHQKVILDVCDVLVDGPYISEKRNILLPFGGSSNQNIWDLKTREIIPDERFKK